MLRVASLLCLLPALALATPPPTDVPRAHVAAPPLLAPGALRLRLSETWEAQPPEDPQQRVRYGVLIGAVMGGLAGMASGVWLCGGIETQDGSGPPFGPACGLVGGAAGAALGAGLGALMEAAVSARPGEWLGPAQGGDAPDALEFGLQLGWMLEPGPRVVDGPTPVGQPPQRVELPVLHGPGANLRLLARLGPYVALGPELALYELLTREFTQPGTGLGGTYGATLYLLGLQARGGPDLGRLRPELVLGFGRFFGDRGAYTGSAGAALSYALSPRFLPQLELRYHHSFQGNPGYVTLGAGAALRW